MRWKLVFFGRVRVGRSRVAPRGVPAPLVGHYGRGAVMLGIVVGVVCLAPAEATAQYADRREVERRLVLGGLNASDWQAFTREPRLIALPDGGAVILAADDASVAVVSPTGQLLHRVGRKGQGPGEFQTVASFGIVGDTLWLRNWPQPRISSFDSAGIHLRTWRSQVQYGDVYSSPQGISGLLRDGYRYASPDGTVLGKPPRSPKPVLLFRDGSEVPDTIMTRPGFDGLVVERVGVFQLRPFPQPPLMSPLPDGAGLLFATWSDGPGVTFSRFDHTGRLVGRFSHSFSRIPVTRRIIEALADSGVAMAREPYEWARREGRPVPANLRVAVEEGLAAPTHFPPIQDMFVAQDDNVWLRLFTRDGDSDWLVLTPAGRALWQVRSPRGVRFQDAVGAFVWGTWVGDYDVPYVARFELIATGR